MLYDLKYLLYVVYDRKHISGTYGQEERRQKDWKHFQKNQRSNEGMELYLTISKSFVFSPACSLYSMTSFNSTAS